MALINCPECGHRCSSMANSCPECGYPISKMIKDEDINEEIIQTNKINIRIRDDEEESNEPIRKGLRDEDIIPKERDKTKILLIIALCLVFVILVFVLISGRSEKNVEKVENIPEATTELVTEDEKVEPKEENADNKTSEMTNLPPSTIRDSNKEETYDKKSSGFEEDAIPFVEFQKNEVITSETCEFVLKGYTITDIVEPTNTAGLYYYTYYEAGDGNTFVDIKFSFKNLNLKAVKQDDIVDSVKIVYDDKYEYDCFFVTVEKDGDLNGHTNLYGINPLETMDYHVLAKVPKEVKESGFNLICLVQVDGVIYECRLR